MLTKLFDPDIMINDLLVEDTLFTLLTTWDHNDLTGDVTLLSKHCQRLVSGGIFFTLLALGDYKDPRLQVEGKRR